MIKEKELEKILKALANRRRLLILDLLLRKKKANVSTISENIKLSLRSTSRHLNVMASADILEKNQQGLEIYYSLAKNPPEIVTLLLK